MPAAKIQRFPSLRAQARSPLFPETVVVYDRCRANRIASPGDVPKEARPGWIVGNTLQKRNLWIVMQPIAVRRRCFRPVPGN